VDTTRPTVSSTIPGNAATGVAVNQSISATFSEAMKSHNDQHRQLYGSGTWRNPRNRNSCL